MPLDDTGKDPRAVEVMDVWQHLKGQRTQHEADWRDIDRLISFTSAGSYSAPDVKRDRTEAKPLSSSPVIALQNFASGLFGTMINPGNRWMGIVAEDPELRAWAPMMEWQELVTARVLASFRPSVSNFYSAAIPLFSDLAGKGNAVQYDEEVPGEGRIIDMTFPLAECVVEIDHHGRVSGNTRKFSQTAKQAATMFGIDNLPEKIANAAKAGKFGDYVFYHRVVRNTEFDQKRLGLPSKKWLSTYVAEEGCMVVRQRGYFEMPFYAPRWNPLMGQTYGLGQGHHALPASRVLNLMNDANLRAGQKAADPTLLAASREDLELDGQIRPGEVLYGGRSLGGTDRFSVLNNFGGTGLSLEMAEQRVQEIKDVFLYSLMQLSQRTGVTATEILEIKAERLRLMAPYLGNVQHEYLAPKIERRFKMLSRAGQLPPPPEGAPAGAELGVEYLSASAMAQKSADGAAAERYVSRMSALAQIDPRAADRIDVDGYAETIAAADGVPSAVLRSREDADQMQQARQQAQQAQQAMEAAQAGAGVMKDVAAAGGGNGA